MEHKSVTMILNKAKQSLEDRDYYVHVVRTDFVLNHFEILVTDKHKHGIAYLNVAIDEKGLRVFGGSILALPHQFMRVVNIIDKED